MRVNCYYGGAFSYLFNHSMVLGEDYIPNVFSGESIGLDDHLKRIGLKLAGVLA